MALPLPLVVLAGVVGVGLVALGVAELRTAQRIRSTDPDPTMDATTGGPVELFGAARPADGTVTAPFSGTDCLLCEYEVLEYKSSGKHSSWQSVDEDTIGVSFHLKDGTGTVLVDPRNATLNLAEEMDRKLKGGTTPPARIRRFIASEPDLDSEDYTYDLMIVEVKGGNDRRFVERRLDVGANVHVVGTARGAYETDAASPLGTVNAVVGAPDVGDGSLIGRWRRRLAGRPFTIADARQGEAAWRVAKPGLVLTVVGLALLVGTYLYGGASL
jgi:hypothetical protein